MLKIKYEPGLRIMSEQIFGLTDFKASTSWLLDEALTRSSPILA